MGKGWLVTLHVMQAKIQIHLNKLIDLQLIEKKLLVLVCDYTFTLYHNHYKQMGVILQSILDSYVKKPFPIYLIY